MSVAGEIQSVVCEFESADGRVLRGDLYRPSGAGPFPALVAVHGGGWSSQSRAQPASWARYLASQGFACFCVDYRLSSEGVSYPGNLQDVQAGIDFLHRQGSDLGIDPERIGLLGTSSGAHLSALAALTSTGYRPKTLVLVYGVYDMVDQWQENLWRGLERGRDLVERTLGGTPFDIPQIYFDASPRRQLTYERARGLKVMLIWGSGRDLVVRPSQSENFALALEQAGAFVRTEEVPGAGHFWFPDEAIDDETGRTRALAPRIVHFLKRHMVS